MKISYGKQFIDKSDIKSLTTAAQADLITQGMYVQEFEYILSKTFKAKYSVVVNNGTSALYLAIKSLKLKYKSKVLLSPITFFSSAYTILMNNLLPDFSDIENQTNNLDLNKLERKLKKDKSIKAIIAVDYAGHPCDWNSLHFLKQKYNLKLINDNCHALGSKINNDIGYAVKYADLVTQSYHPTKNFTTGEGGSILTQNKKLFKIIENYRNHGIIRNKKLSKEVGKWFYKVTDYGFNFRISDILCALGVSQIKKLKKFVIKKNSIAKIYDSQFSNYDFLETPKILKNYFHSYHLYPLKIDFKKLGISKNFFFTKMQKDGINLQVHYIPVHTQPFLRQYGFKFGMYPVSEDFYQKEVSLPIYYSLDKKKLDYIITAVKKNLKIN